LGIGFSVFFQTGTAEKGTTMTEPKSKAAYQAVWIRSDWACASLTAIISLAVYVITVAPNVSLLDSGEFLVAALHFGVPHPTGYPMWTFLAWLFQFLIPWGNDAWKVNLMSAMFGALSTGLLAAMGHSAVRWLFPSAHRMVTIAPTVAFSLLFAFSVSAWSQATIAEVYTLHSFLVGLYILSIYLLIRNPSGVYRIVSSIFFLTLAFSNHHLALVLTPLVFLVVLLLRRELFLDLVISSVLTAVLYYLCFALLSQEKETLQAAIRFSYMGGAVFLIALWCRRGRIEWKLVAWLPVAVGLGLASYLYLPLASSTNPPMNWGYTKTTEGFFYSFNRSQYGGSLSDLLLATVGRAMGVDVPENFKDPVVHPAFERGKFQILQDWTGFFWIKLTESFTLLAILCFFLPILAVLRLPLPQRVWIYLLNIAFLLAAFVQPITSKAEIDNAGWWLQMPYHTYTNFLFGLLCLAGCVRIFLWIQEKSRRLIWLCWFLLLLPLWTAYQNYDVCSQRDRWFGWEFGHTMLKNLPEGSVIFGGTDPGRFVPTYMIFGESPQAGAAKRNPDFDRQDLYILTQNAMADPMYLRYIRDHYTEDRPPVRNFWERALGRQHQYPEDFLVLPTEEQMEEIVVDTLRNHPAPNASDRLTEAHSRVSQWVFEKNRDRHEFFIEESFPMKWSYDYAVPHGYLLRLMPEKIDSIPAGLVSQDFAFWENKINELFENPRFHGDYDAKRTFGKVRTAMGNLYRHHEMDREAEAAYRQALAIWPENPEAILPLSSILWKKHDFKEVQNILHNALEHDPNSRHLILLLGLALKREDLQKAMEETRSALDKDPGNPELLLTLIRLHDEADEPEAMMELFQHAGMESILTNLTDAEYLFSLLATKQAVNEGVVLATKLQEVLPNSTSARILEAKFFFTVNQGEDAYASLREAIRAGGTAALLQIRSDHAFFPLHKEEEFVKLLETSTSGTLAP
jgi:tetratricopeptide (TPR) repeat protein